MSELVSGHCDVAMVTRVRVLQGIVEPHSVLDVPMIITPQGLEELQVTAHVMVFGSADVPLVSRACAWRYHLLRSSSAYIS